MRNQKSRMPMPEIPLKNEKSRTLNVEVIYPSTFTVVDELQVSLGFSTSCISQAFLCNLPILLVCLLDKVRII